MTCLMRTGTSSPQERRRLRQSRLSVDGKMVKLGVEICEDLWDTDYDVKVTDLLVERGAELVVNISASPFLVGKHLERNRLLNGEGNQE